jgi:acid phosphatase family membrane protein YuiD
VVYNPYIIVPLATWAVAQVAKFGIAAIRGRVDFRYLYASGGMPSVHSAVVSSLAVTALLVDGFGSHLFGFTVIFAAVVMYDSFGVRRSTGEQAVALNMLFDNLERNKFKMDTKPPKIREILGHQPREVVAGAITGTALAGVFNYTYLGQFGDFMRAIPTRYEIWAYAALFAVLIIGGVIAGWAMKARYPKSKVMKRFRRRIFTAAQTTGWLGLVMLVFVYEHASYLAWRLWPLTVIAIGLAWAVLIVTGPGKAVPAGLAAEMTQARKRKWLNFGRKSR